jgi:hypothetical protein
MRKACTAALIDKNEGVGRGWGGGGARKALLSVKGMVVCAFLSEDHIFVLCFVLKAAGRLDTNAVIN